MYEVTPDKNIPLLQSKRVLITVETFAIDYLVLIKNWLNLNPRFKTFFSVFLNESMVDLKTGAFSEDRRQFYLSLSYFTAINLACSRRYSTVRKGTGHRFAS